MDVRVPKVSLYRHLQPREQLRGSEQRLVRERDESQVGQRPGEDRLYPLGTRPATN